MDSVSQNVSLLLQNLNRGDSAAERKLISVIYDELRHLAACYMRRERPDHTLQATAVVHEAFMRLTKHKGINWEGKADYVCGRRQTYAANPN
jgi:RNA polymerase sigma-70 factor (ECF subfamily)